VVRKDDFICFERVRGRLVNILAGLELHTGVFSAAEQRRIVECVYALQERGKRGELGGEAYTVGNYILVFVMVCLNFCIMDCRSIE
jgi:hypothetical protein